MTSETRNHGRIGARVRLRHGALVVLMLGALLGVAVYALGGVKGDITIPREGLIVLAIFLSGIVASVAGFAFSAIAGAFIVHLYSDPVEMVRVLLVCSITIQAYCTLRVLGSIKWRELAPYLVGGLLGAPVGVFMLTRLSSHAYAVALGAFLIAYGLWSLRTPVRVDAHGKPLLDALFGALGGITGGFAASPGAFVAMWCSARGLAKETQRAICQPYIFFLQIATLAMVEHARSPSAISLSQLWIFVPVSLLAACIGFALFQRLTGTQFRIVVLNVLIASGVVLVAKSW